MLLSLDGIVNFLSASAQEEMSPFHCKEGRLNYPNPIQNLIAMLMSPPKKDYGVLRSLNPDGSSLPTFYLLV